VEAYQGDIIMPNRHEDAHGTTYQGHVLAAETYVGGHVEALEAGVFRSDIPTQFKVVPEAIQGVCRNAQYCFWYLRYAAE
jgi:DNA polymerase epsilon subunit 1